MECTNARFMDRQSGIQPFMLNVLIFVSPNVNCYLDMTVGLCMLCNICKV